MWHEITGPLKRYAGSSGTVTLPRGAKVISISAHATSAGTLAMNDGVGGTITIPIPANTWFVYDPKHLGYVANAAFGANLNLVFASTDSYFVEVQCKDGF